MPYVHRPKSEKQLDDNYKSRVKKRVNGFESLTDFKNWYRDQELSCHFCGLTEQEMQELSMTGILTSKRFPQDGIVGRGTNRGVWLEVDRIDPNGLYSRDNCVLCCYFCNNDKSDVFAGIQYAQFFQNRVAYLRQLLNERGQ
jgi:hypothetical protein